MSAHAQACTRARTHARTRARANTPLHTHISTYTCLSTHVCMRMPTHICPHSHVCTDFCAHMSAHTRLHTCLRTYLCTARGRGRDHETAGTGRDPRLMAGTGGPDRKLGRGRGRGRPLTLTSAACARAWWQACGPSSTRTRIRENAEIQRRGGFRAACPRVRADHVSHAAANMCASTCACEKKKPWRFSAGADAGLMRPPRSPFLVKAQGTECT